MECYNRGILTDDDTEGIDLTWGNHAGIVAALEKLGRREGRALASFWLWASSALPSRSAAAARLSPCTLGGQELPMHDMTHVSSLASR